jgi:mRNA interferase RelE/StbE
MTYRITHTPEAERQFLALPVHIQRRVARWYALLAEDPRRAQTRQLSGHPELRRVHAGHEYVIVFAVRESEVLVLIVRVGHRREIYRRLPDPE